MITDWTEKPLTADATYREGTLWCELWEREITVDLYDEEVTEEYAEKCAEALNSMPERLVDDICRSAKKYCLCYMDEIAEDISDDLTVPIDEDTPEREILRCFYPTALVVEPPQDPSRTGYQLSCECDWEPEHGMEIDILDNVLVYLCEYSGCSPWDDHSDEPWNYALDN
ncbi:MAG: hypothetical protein J5822_03985 [Eubacteriaceae bacterium]|nr:hypothetical protein [Eubacteriaceae bacterium]